MEDSIFVHRIIWEIYYTRVRARARARIYVARDVTLAIRQITLKGFPR